MPQNWVIGNWKMNGNISANAELLAAVDLLQPRTQICKIAVSVPYPYLSQAQRALEQSGVLLAAQNVSQYDAGAYTGEVSIKMLKEFGVSLVLIGHSERRSLFGETDEVVAAKAAAVIQAGLTPVVCIGESLSEREKGLARKVVLRQFKAISDALGSALNQIVLAYEPVWAIGTGLSATPVQAQEVHAWLRAAAKQAGAEDISILYGGSVKSDNAAEIFRQTDVNGGLIGGASLNVEEFSKICQACK